MKKRKVQHFGEVPKTRPKHLPRPLLSFRFSGSRRGRLLHKEKREKMGTAGPYCHQHRHSPTAPEQGQYSNHPTTTNQVQGSVQEAQPDSLKLRADLLTTQLRHRARLRLYSGPRPRSRAGAWVGVPGEAAQGNHSPSGQSGLDSSSLWALGNT